MITLLSRLFIKDRENYTDERVRRSYGALCSCAGIFLNVLLFAGKYLAGVLSGSIAVTADAFNNLSDAGSSVITLAGFRMASKKADPGHPFGHGRIEHLSALAVPLILIAVGVQLARDSIAKIAAPEAVDAGWLPMAILAASIAVKDYMYLYNSSVGKKIASPGMRATALDSLTDCIATFAALASMLIYRFTRVNIDGWAGAAVALFIMWSGFTAARDTLSPLLGTPPSKELVNRIYAIVLAHPEIRNVHDLVVHDYGPGRLMISLHAEVPADGDLCELHDTIDTAEYELQKELGCSAVIHMDPVSIDDGKTSRMRAAVAAHLDEICPGMTLHDFRIVDGPTHTNVIFDAVLPLDAPISEEEAKEKLDALVASLWENSHPKVHIDRPYI